MAKRFTETNMWDEDWFLDLSNEGKLFWIFITLKCNHAGIWRKNIRMFTSICGQIDLNETTKEINKGKERIIVLPSGNYFLPGFFHFQYGENFNENNRLHESISKELAKENLSIENCYLIKNQIVKRLTSNSPLTEDKEGVKDKDKDIDKDKEKDIYSLKKEYEKKTLKIVKKEKEDFSKILELGFNKAIEVSIDFDQLWLVWLAFKKSEFGFSYKTDQSSQTGLEGLKSLSESNYKKAQKIVLRSIQHRWKGFQPLPETLQKENPVISMFEKSEQAKEVARLIRENQMIEG